MPAPIIYSTVSIAPPPPNWSGDARALFALLAQNLQVRNPAGYNTFTVGPAAPATDSGPWLKDGREWYVWDLATNAYIPQRLAAAYDSSSGIPMVTSLTDAKVVNGTDSGFCLFLHAGVGCQLMRYEGGGNWRKITDDLRGPTAVRPVNPKQYTKFFDTDIGCEIYWNGGNWTTVAGGLNDIKAVAFSTEVDALRYNPGWEIFNMSAGRAIAGSFGARNGLTDRAPLAGSDGSVGTENHTLTLQEIAPHDHGPAHTDTTGGVPAPGGFFTTGNGTPDFPYVLDINAGNNAMISKRTTIDGGGLPHNNMQPTLFLIHLRKAIV